MYTKSSSLRVSSLAQIKKIYKFVKAIQYLLTLASLGHIIDKISQNIAILRK